ncbi:hypothetical protein ACFRAE_16655 [Sphingobacterium sp. HJSM2_6]|uniref:hypothetical protein n=1 Tax=Sphingobacterium sp. HJSM2_6 TaxID=3366264 RepID=UPI003BD986D9
MKFLKYFIYTGIGLMLLISISLLLVRWTRLNQAENLRIPQNAQSLIQIETDKLIFDFIKEEIIQFPKGKEKDSVDKEQTKPWQIGVSIPAKLNLFALNDEPLQYYGKFKISDFEDFEQWLQKSNLPLTQVASESDSTTYFTYDSKRFALLSNKQQVVLAWGNLTEHYRVRMEELLRDDESTWDLAETRLSASLKATNNHVRYVDRQGNWFGLRFGSGDIHMQGEIASESFLFPKQFVMLEDTDRTNELARLEVNTDLPRLLNHSESYLEKLAIPVDSIKPYLGNYMGFEWKKGEVSQWETIINYEYDDNFEQIEKKELHELKVPNMAIRMKASPHLLNLLPNKLFYQLNTAVYADFVKLSTEKPTNASVEKLVASPYVFLLRANLSNIHIAGMSWLPAKSGMESIELLGKPLSATKISLDGSVIFKNKNQNSFYQILDNQSL